MPHMSLIIVEKASSGMDRRIHGGVWDEPWIYESFINTRPSSVETDLWFGEQMEQ